MPQTKSAKKALKQSQKRKVNNLTILKKLKAIIKQFKQNPKLQDLIRVQSVIDKAAKRGIVSENRGARLKSKLSKLAPKPKSAKQARVAT